MSARPVSTHAPHLRAGTVEIYSVSPAWTNPRTALAEEAGTVRQRAESIQIWGSSELLVRMVAALVREAAPSLDLNDPTDRLPALPPDGVIVEVHPSRRWLYLSAAPHPGAESARALSDGASAILTLSSSFTEWVLALGALLEEGQVFVASEVLQWMANESLGRKGWLQSEAKLTGREREVLELVASGHTNSEIADALGIAVNTVRTHLHALSVKLEASSRTKLIANAQAMTMGDDHAPNTRASA